MFEEKDMFEENDLMDEDLEGDELDSPSRGLSREAKYFIEGLIVGFGLGAAIYTVFGILRGRRARFYELMAPQRRMLAQDESGGIIGDFAHVVDEGTSAFKEAVQTVERVTESVARGVETFQDLLEKMRR